MSVRFSWRVLRHTVVCPNGHRCCKICVKTLARQIIFGGLAVCPLCRQSGMFRDAPEVDEELMRQQAKCPFVRSWSGQACQWTGPYGEMWNHVHHFADPPRTADHQAVDRADHPAVDPSASATEQQTSRNGAAWREFSRDDLTFTSISANFCFFFRYRDRNLIRPRRRGGMDRNWTKYFQL